MRRVSVDDPQDPQHAMEGRLDELLERWGGQVAILGGLLWTASWLLNVSLTDSSGEGTRLGLTEGNARAILNPAILLIGVGVLAFKRCLERHPNASGAGEPRWPRYSV